jgi:hypothetical protein
MKPSSINPLGPLKSFKATVTILRNMSGTILLQLPLAQSDMILSIFSDRHGVFSMTEDMPTALSSLQKDSTWTACMSMGLCMQTEPYKTNLVCEIPETFSGTARERLGGAILLLFKKLRESAGIAPSICSSLSNPTITITNFLDSGS